MALKKLPLGIQDFEKMHQTNSIYVDKTHLIYQLIQPGQAFYFLSRPRRFGKSLLLSTIAYLFEGRKELFEGLWISENTDYAFEDFPVIKIDFNQVNHAGHEVMTESILILLNEIAIKHGLSITHPHISNYFSSLIQQLAEKYNKDVVVLIDEYDKPIISHIGKGEEEHTIADKNRDVLKQLFGVLKGQDVAKHLRLVFMTGVSKFSRVSVFSDLNNLRDLTGNPTYADLLGYTEKELYQNFEEHIEELSESLSISETECKERLRTWYNGYRFTERDIKVYNPFSTLSVLLDKTFQNYWFETGTPTFLINLIKKYNYPIPQIEQLELRDTAFTKYDIETLSLPALLFQTGYITIKSTTRRQYNLSYPNQEVKNSFLDYIYEKLIPIKNDIIKSKFTYLADYLEEKRLDDFIDTVNVILASLTYHQSANQDEAYYHTVFYLMLAASAVEVQSEVLTSLGRIDIVVFFDEMIYIIELKCDQSAHDGIKQIKDNEYAKRYEKEDKEIYLMGINFDSEQRKIIEWICEPY